jgi:hypothetical protein
VQVPPWKNAEYDNPNENQKLFNRLNANQGQLARYPHAGCNFTAPACSRPPREPETCAREPLSQTLQRRPWWSLRARGNLTRHLNFQSELQLPAPVCGLVRVFKSILKLYERYLLYFR